MEKLLRIAKTKLLRSSTMTSHFLGCDTEKHKKYRGDKKANRVKYKMIQESNNRSIYGN